MLVWLWLTLLETLARLLGRLPPFRSCVGVVDGNPNDRRLTCWVDSGVPSPVPLRDEVRLALLPPVRFLGLRIVTVAGTWLCPRMEPLRGDARGGVYVGAGSFDRAE